MCGDEVILFETIGGSSLNDIRWSFDSKSISFKLTKDSVASGFLNERRGMNFFKTNIPLTIEGASEHMSSWFSGWIGTKIFLKIMTLYGINCSSIGYTFFTLASDEDYAKFLLYFGEFEIRTNL